VTEKGLRRLLRELLPSMEQRALTQPYVALNLRDRLAAGLHQLERFQLELAGIGLSNLGRHHSSSRECTLS